MRFTSRHNRQVVTAPGGTLVGTERHDWLVGSATADQLVGGLGNDFLFGGGGADRVEGGEGQDRIAGDADNDTLFGGTSDDLLFGGDGDDSLDGGDGNDILRGGAGNDFAWGGAGDDLFRGGEGNDTVRSGEGSDSVFGEEGDDVLCPAGGNDKLSGGEGNDILWGGDGDDHAAGNYGNDLLTGGNGSDHLAGCLGDDVFLSRSDAGEPDPAAAGAVKVFGAQVMVGDDTLRGDDGADTFRFEFLVNARPDVIDRWTRPDGTIDWDGVVTEDANAHDHWVDGIGNDMIEDYSRRNGDQIEIFGHDIVIGAIDWTDVNADGRMDSVVRLRSAAEGAHGGDLLGTITVMRTQLTEADILFRDDVVIGAFTTLEFGQFPGDRFGTFPFGFSGLEDWMGSV